MNRPLYTKIVQGHVEQIYDQEGNCIGQMFVVHEEAPVDRRIIRLEGEEQDGGLEHDEIIEHPDDIRELESREKFQAFDMVQPTPLP